MTTDIELASGGTADGIRYVVHPNGGASKLKGEPVYTARVLAETISLSDIAEAMVSRGCPFAKSYIVAVLTDVANVMGDLLQRGNAVNLGGLVTLRPTIKGTFESEDGAFDPAQNRLGVVATVGPKLRNVASGAPTLKETPVRLPAIDQLFNMADGSEGTLCSRGQFMVLGSRLTWDDAKDDEGFVLNLMGVETKCPVIVPDPKGKKLVLRTTQTMSPGDTPELFFYTRINGGFYQIRFGGALACVEPPATPEA